MLRAIVSQITKESEVGQSNGTDSVENGYVASHMKKSSLLKWESGTRKKAKHFAEDFADWEDPNTFIAALEKIETWIFSRLVESVWWQVRSSYCYYIAELQASKVAIFAELSWLLEQLLCHRMQKIPETR